MLERTGKGGGPILTVSFEGKIMKSFISFPIDLHFKDLEFQ